MTISKLETKKIIRLASILCSEEDIDFYTSDLNKIVDSFNQLKSINTDIIEPMVVPIDEELSLRDDEPAHFNSREDVLKNVPKSKDNFYVIPKIMD